MNYRRILYFLLISILLSSACSDRRWKVDMEGREHQLNWERFELDLFELSEQGLRQSEVEELEGKYPQLLPLYLQSIMRFGELGSQSAFTTLANFTADTNIRQLFQAVRKAFPRNSLEEELKFLERGLLRYQFHFPEKKLPRVKSMISAFTYSTVAADSLLVIGLDNYLGKDFELYPQAGIPEYKFSHFSREYMVSDALKAWMLTEFEGEAAQNLLGQMVYHGKILYFLQACLPETEAATLMNYSKDELNWCEQNAEEIWSHFLEMELLFTSENYKIRKYLGDSPFIPGFPEGSPGRVGQWVGFQIVKQFMEKQQEYTMRQLMELEDANRILRESKYKPL